MELSSEWNKKESQEQSHITPNHLQIDFGVKAILAKDLKDSILNQVSSKLKESGVEVTLTPFFDKNLLDKMSKL